MSTSGVLQCLRWNGHFKVTRPKRVAICAQTIVVFLDTIRWNLKTRLLQQLQMRSFFFFGSSPLVFWSLGPLSCTSVLCCSLSGTIRANSNRICDLLPGEFWYTLGLRQYGLQVLRCFYRERSTDSPVCVFPATKVQAWTVIFGPGNSHVLIAEMGEKHI